MIGRGIGTALAWLLAAGCPAEPTVAPPPAPREPPTPPPEATSRYMRIRALLEEPPESPRRAMELYPLVEPICSDEQERAAFLETATWSSSLSTDDLYITRTLAEDTIEHVATTCYRSHPAPTLDLLIQAEKSIPGTYRFDLVRARLHASSGELASARIAAEEAKAAGSFHAVALLANLLAQEAREAGVGYRAGMLDAAIATVTVDFDGKWPLVDVAAVLSTRARLLTERAIWEDEDLAKKTLLVANEAYGRLSRPPFIENIRTRAEDVSCFDAAVGGGDLMPCKEAGERAKNLGAARAAGVAMVEADGFDMERLRAIERLAGDMASLPKGKVVLVVARGDEGELIEWARPAAVVLRALAARGARIIAIDRTSTPRARALFSRILELGGQPPFLSIDATSTLAMPCVTAILADRKTPGSCPLGAVERKKLEAMDGLFVSILVGRDLDAEIDDLKLYGLRAVLLSFRESRMEKGIDAWLKSVSDVLIVGKK